MSVFRKIGGSFLNTSRALQGSLRKDGLPTIPRTKILEPRDYASISAAWATHRKFRQRCEAADATADDFYQWGQFLECFGRVGEFKILSNPMRRKYANALMKSQAQNCAVKKGMYIPGIP